MCYKQTTCPMFESRTINGIKGACHNCEYVKRFEKRAFYSKIGLIVAILAFITTTFIIY